MYTLQAFGSPKLESGDGVPLLGVAGQPKRFSFLIYLACSGGDGTLRRDHLTAMFWPDADQERASNALRQTVFVLRRELGKDLFQGMGTPELRVDPSALTSDVAEFRRALADGNPEAALDLYRGEFLQAFHLPGAPGFCFWEEDRRAELHRMAVRAAQGLARTAEGARDLPGALYWWRLSLELDPFDEPALCRIVTLLASSGRRGAAMAEFDRFRRRNEVELGIPMSHLLAQLAARTRSGGLAGAPDWLPDRRRRRDARPRSRGRTRRVCDGPVTGGGSRGR